MSDKHDISQSDLEFLLLFKERMQQTEERYRDVPSSPEKIAALLGEISDFYQAKRTFVLETDWDMEFGTFTYDYEKESTNPVLQTCVQINGVAKWINQLKLNRPVVLEGKELQESAADYPEIEAWGELKILMTAPFSNRLYRGIICVLNPERFQNRIGYLAILSYAIAADINALKLQERIGLIEKQIPPMDEYEIRVQCFGGLQIHTAKGTLSDEHITAEQCYRLLSYLLMNYGKIKPTREMADIIWDEAPLNDPYRDIKNIVYRLKRFLNMVELDDFVIGTRGTFAINPKYKLHLDFEEFETVYNDYFKAETSEERAALHKKAKAIYLGVLLPRCDHLHWFMPRTRYYQSMYLRLIKAHIEEQLEMGQYFEAQKSAVEGLELEAFDTDFMVYQIVSMMKQGNKSMANSYYSKIIDQLTDEQKAFIEKQR